MQKEPKNRLLLRDIKGSLVQGGCAVWPHRERPFIYMLPFLCLSSDNLYYNLLGAACVLSGSRFTNARSYRRCKRYQGGNYYCNKFFLLFFIHKHLPFYRFAVQPLQHALPKIYYKKLQYPNYYVGKFYKTAFCAAFKNQVFVFVFI